VTSLEEAVHPAATSNATAIHRRGVLRDAGGRRSIAPRR
jgi:hypothetical protein